MAVKIELNIVLEEYSTTESMGEVYKCVIIATANGTKVEKIFNDPLSALTYAKQLVFSWVQIFVKLKRDTRKKLQQRQQVKSRIIRP